MSVRRMTSYRLFLVRSALARVGRALAYYWVTLRTAVRAGWRSYPFTLVRNRTRSAGSAAGRQLYRLPRRTGSLLGLIVWFLGQLPPYLGRVLQERREDRADLRAERRLAAAARRAERAERRDRRRAQFAEIKADSQTRLSSVPVPAWIARMERPERPQRPGRLPAPRTAMVAAAVALVAAVPAYAVVSGALGSDGRGDAAISGDPGDFVGTLPPLPTAAPTIPPPGAVGPRATAAGTAPAVTAPAGTAPAGTAPAGTAPVGTAPVGTAPVGTATVTEATVSGSTGRPLSLHQQREARREAKWEAKQARIAKETAKQLAKDDGK